MPLRKASIVAPDSRVSRPLTARLKLFKSFVHAGVYTAESGFPVWQVADILEILRSIDDDTERAEFLAQVLVEGPWQDAERPARGSTSTEEHFPRADGLA